MLRIFAHPCFLYRKSFGEEDRHIIIGTVKSVSEYSQYVLWWEGRQGFQMTCALFSNTKTGGWYFNALRILLMKPLMPYTCPNFDWALLNFGLFFRLGVLNRLPPPPFWAALKQWVKSFCGKAEYVPRYDCRSWKGMAVVPSVIVGCACMLWMITSHS